MIETVLGVVAGLPALVMSAAVTLLPVSLGGFALGAHVVAGTMSERAVDVVLAPFDAVAAYGRRYAVRGRRRA